MNVLHTGLKTFDVSSRQCDGETRCGGPARTGRDGSTAGPLRSQVKAAMTTLLNGSGPWVLSLSVTRGGRRAFEQLSCPKQTVAALRQRRPLLECPPFQRM